MKLRECLLCAFATFLMTLNWGALVIGADSSAAAVRPAATAPRFLPASPEKLPRWRGFNLLEKFMLGNGRKPFVEDDFRMMSRWGFNFVRLPIDYRFWIKDGDWEQFDEPTLREIDQAVAWGEKYGIHVCINFHRAPGYTVARPPEKTSLWTDPKTQEVCAKHWAMFARRYRGIPSERVSFNLMNEPAGVSAEQYLAVVRKLAAAIRAEDPNRLIISDGLQWGTVALPELKELKIAMATRGYSPMEISHYKASWVNSEHFPEPQWPRLVPPNGLLLGPHKGDDVRPLEINGPFASETQLRMRVGVVSAKATLIVEADKKEVFRKAFVCGPGEGEWKQAIYKPEWKIYQNLFDRDYTATIPPGTQRVTLQVIEGDWLKIRALGFVPRGSAEMSLPMIARWGQRLEPFRFAPDAPNGPFPTLPVQGRQWLYDQNITPWKKSEAMGIGVMVGEWGAYNKTPHDVVLRWAEDCLKNWQEAGWGWAMWNFRGPFGILDSGRTDVQYEEFEGHKLDRKLLDLLLKY